MAVVGLAASSLCGAEELRGAWLSAWSPGYYTADQVDATIAAAKKAGINALFIQVRKNADSYYDSKLEPRGNGIAADFDPLAYTIEKAHAQGIAVHAWVNAYRVWSSAPLPTDPKHIVNQHPEWITKSSDGKTRASEGLYLDPGVAEANEHIAKVVVDIATRYDVDGVQWDYVRYPGADWGYADAALSRYYADSSTTTKPDAKDPKWLQWKRDQITGMVRSVYGQLHKIKPKLLVSASTIVWGNCPSDFTKSDAYATVCQDWKSWMADGTMDANIPMTYKPEKTEKSAKSFRDWLVGFAKWNGGRPVYVGIDVGSNDNAGVIAQIAATRKAGLDGYVLFAFNESKRRDSLVDDMASAASAACGSGAKSITAAPAGAVTK